MFMTFHRSFLKTLLSAGKKIFSVLPDAVSWRNFCRRIVQPEEIENSFSLQRTVDFFCMFNMQYIN